jgi:hypothetical protein
VIHAYLDYDIVAIYNDVTAVIIKPIKQLTGTASLNKQMSRKSTPLIDSMHCINEAILYLGNNDANSISEEVLSSLNGLIKISVDATQHSAKLHFPLELQVILSPFPFYLLVGCSIEETGYIRYSYTPQRTVLFCC